MPSMAQFFGDFNSRQQIDTYHKDDGISSLWNIYDFAQYALLWPGSVIIVFSFSFLHSAIEPQSRQQLGGLLQRQWHAATDW